MFTTQRREKVELAIGEPIVVEQQVWWVSTRSGESFSGKFIIAHSASHPRIGILIDLRDILVKTYDSPGTFEPTSEVSIPD
jgi:hypothetical protein